ncbi:MAG: AAA family ATPase [Spirochaetaceae bacterium]|nr:MAG: AAA family ATPase [Spirochaetaceae bacterium]
MDLSLDQERQPLAARMRPRTLDEFVGQEHIVGPGRLLRRAIEADQLQSIILSGPPGTGKTTLARVVAERTRSQFISINAVLSGVKDIRDAIEKAKDFADRTNRRTLLFVDEVHRWNKSQQDALLPWVENGLLVLIGATTENPYFEVNRALLSRSRVFLLSSLTGEDLQRVIDLALTDRERGYGAYRVTITGEARDHLVTTASGDARTLLNALELAVETSVDRYPPPPGTEILITLEVAEDSIQRRAVLYDKDGDYHFDTISAFIKSVRGSDPDAALYWLARMVTAGEDPRYILRRLLILASEDVGLADPHALVVVNACAASFDRVGMPEGQFHLAQATLYCAAAPKSNSTLGYFDALKAVQAAQGDEVPDHLRDASRDGEELGHGRDYLYPHAYRDHWVAQQYLPETLQGNLFYQPGELGWEKERRRELEERRDLQLAVEREETLTISTAPPSHTASARWLRRIDQGILEEALALRNQVLHVLGPSGTDRVLLCGAPFQLLAWEVLRRTQGGLAAIWSADEADLEALRHRSGRSPLAEIEQPQLAGPVQPGWRPGERESIHPGPFEKILYRPPPEGGESWSDPETVLNWLLPLLVKGGTLLVLQVLPLECTRPSSVIPLPDDLAAILRAAEEKVFPDREKEWIPALQRLHLEPMTHISRLHTSTTRTLSREALLGWFDPRQPVGAALIELSGPDTAARIGKIAGSESNRDIPWKRTFLTVRIAPDRS